MDYGLSLYMDADLNLTVSKQKVNSSVVVAPALLLDRREYLIRVKNGSNGVGQHHIDGCVVLDIVLLMLHKQVSEVYL